MSEIDVRTLKRNSRNDEKEIREAKRKKSTNEEETSGKKRIPTPPPPWMEKDSNSVEVDSQNSNKIEFIETISHSFYTHFSNDNQQANMNSTSKKRRRKRGRKRKPRPQRTYEELESILEISFLREGDVIVFKKIELSNTLTPVMSNYKKVKIIRLDCNKKEPSVEVNHIYPPPHIERKKRNQGFQFQNDEFSDVEDDYSELRYHIAFVEMNDIRLLERYEKPSRPVNLPPPHLPSPEDLEERKHETIIPPPPPPKKTPLVESKKIGIEKHLDPKTWQFHQVKFSNDQGIECIGVVINETEDTNSMKIQHGNKSVTIKKEEVKAIHPSSSDDTGRICKKIEDLSVGQVTEFHESNGSFTFTNFSKNRFEIVDGKDLYLMKLSRKKKRTILML